MLQIAICDDNANFAWELETLLLQEAKKDMIDIDTDVYIDGDELVRDYRNDGVRHDFIYLDIEMARVGGIEAARQIREMDRTVLIIYVSNHEEHCKDLFVFEPVRFLSKPLDSDKFRRTFLEACKRVGYLGASFQYFYNKKIHEVQLRDVIYFENVGRKVYIHLVRNEEEEKEAEGQEKETYFYGRSLNDIEKELEENNRPFLRIHRCYIVNYDHLCESTQTSVKLKNEAGVMLTFEIAKNRQEKVRHQLGQIHGSR